MFILEEKRTDIDLIALKVTRQSLPQRWILSRSVLILSAEIVGLWTISRMLVSSANNLISQVISSVMSFINTRNNKGPSMEPCGTPASTGNHEEVWPQIIVRCERFDRFSL